MKLRNWITNTREVLELNKKLGDPIRKDYMLWKVIRKKPDFSKSTIEFTSSDQEILITSTDSKTHKYSITVRAGEKVQIKSCALPKYGMAGIKDASVLSEELLDLEVTNVSFDQYWVTVSLGEAITPSEVNKHKALVAKRTKAKTSAKRAPRMDKDQYMGVIKVGSTADQGYVRRLIEKAFNIKWTEKVPEDDVIIDHSGKCYGSELLTTGIHIDRSEHSSLKQLLKLYGGYGVPNVRSPEALQNRFTSDTMLKKLNEYFALAQSDRFGSAISFINQSLKRKNDDISEWKAQLYKDGYISEYKGMVPSIKEIKITKELEKEWEE